MTYIRTRVFCFRIPIRAGVLILSLTGTIFGSIITIAGWIQVSRNPDIAIPYVFSTLFTIMALLSLFGFTSSWMRRRNLIVAYKVRLVAYMLIILICGPGVLAPLYVAPEIFGFCGFESADQTTIGACKPGIGVSKGWILVIFIITWLLEIYTYIINALSLPTMSINWIKEKQGTQLNLSPPLNPPENLQ